MAFNETFSGVLLAGDPSAAFILIKPLLGYIVGIAIYSLFIFRFYRFIARRDLLKLGWHERYGRESAVHRFFKSIFYTLEHIVLVPLAIFIWFGVLASILFLMGSSSVPQVMLISMALVGAIRLCAYYNEDLSRDLAKMMPFALLGIFLIDTNILTSPLDRLAELLAFPDQLLSYLLFVVLLEFVFHVLHFIYIHLSRHSARKQELGFQE